jgi:hypothetical protein
MARPFDPKKLAQQLCPRLFYQLLVRLHADADWGEAASDPDPKAVTRMAAQLSQQRAQDLHIVLQDVHALSDERALGVLNEEIAWRCKDAELEQYALQEGRGDRALWAYLYAPQAFSEGSLFARAEALAAGPSWQCRSDLPLVALTVDDGLKERLARQLTAFYYPAQGRGRFCHVEHYLRAGASDYFFCYLDNYPDRQIVFDRRGNYRQVQQLQAFDNVFAFSAIDGTLGTYARGGRKVHDALQRAFGRAVFDMELDQVEPHERSFRLNHLLNPSTPLPTHPDDGIAEVRICRFRLEPLENSSRAITVSADLSGPAQDIHLAIKRYINLHNVPLHMFSVESVTFKITLAGQYGQRGKPFRFTLGSGGTCDLKSRPEEIRILGERLLRDWGIAGDDA